jgi:hypothetical protein
MFHQKKKPEVDVIRDLLRVAHEAWPESGFIQGLYVHYEEKGGLSRKQLEGLQKKLQKLDDLPIAWMATLEAEILKKPIKFRTPLPQNKPLFEKDERVGKMIGEVLDKFPQHKRVLFLKNRYDNNEVLSPADITELEKFHKILMGK